MDRERLRGTLKVWPGVAEELLGTKAYYLRAGVFKDVDVCLFAHVGSNLGVGWGPTGGSGLVSVEYLFKGESAQAAAALWRGKARSTRYLHRFAGHARFQRACRRAFDE